MITPKEKAKELVDKFYQTTPNEAFINEPYGIGAEYKAWEQAKECALIAVEEILKTRPGFPYPNELGLEIKGIFNIINYPIVYWQEVKKEIEKL
jgi:hypothetical protein